MALTRVRLTPCGTTAILSACSVSCPFCTVHHCRSSRAPSEPQHGIVESAAGAQRCMHSFRTAQSSQDGQHSSVAARQQPVRALMTCRFVAAPLATLCHCSPGSVLRWPSHGGVDSTRCPRNSNQMHPATSVFCSCGPHRHRPSCYISRLQGNFSRSPGVQGRIKQDY